MRLALAGLIAASAVLAACAGERPSVTAPEVARSFALAPGNNVLVITEDEIVRQSIGTAPTNAWVLYTRAAGTGTFRSGPGVPPLGVGSLQFATPAMNDKVFLFNFEQEATKLSDINALSYSSHRSAGSAQQVAALNIVIDFNGDAPDGFATLVFEPVYNTTQGAVADGLWQSWDAILNGEAIWWSTRMMPGVPSASNSFVRWADIVTANPDAVIKGGFGFNQGGGNPTLVSAVDKLTLGVGLNAITYDLEPFRVATTADACKSDGWKKLKRADGSEFKNQGDCVSYVNTGK